MNCPEISFQKSAGHEAKQEAPVDRKETIHYHIRWAQIPLLDFESFNTRLEAEAAAQVLARPGETHTIEEQGEGCQRCRDAQKEKSERDAAQVYREPE